MVYDVGAGAGVAAAVGRPLAAVPRDEHVVLDEAGFRDLYLRTARPLRSYLYGATGDPSAAEDLMQESFLRLIRSGFASDDAQHLKNYLYRIATNLVRDRFRRRRFEVGREAAEGADERVSERLELRADVWRMLGALKARDRQMLWLAYAEGSSHEEIAAVLGLKAASVRSMLFRARERMVALLRASGFAAATGGAP